MAIRIPYKGKIIEVEIPDRIQTEIIYPNEVLKRQSEPCVFGALKDPVNSVSFEEFIQDSPELLFIVNDATRPTPTAKILGILKGYLKDKTCRFLVATGTHRAPSGREIRSIFGQSYAEFKANIFIHDARSDDQMFRAGVTATGNGIWLNQAVAEARKIVAINSVEPHYFAGFTGGRKSFFPGLSSYKTVEGNHRLAMSPQASSLKLEGNPVHEDMMDCLRVLNGKDIFSIQTVLNRHHDVVAAYAGDIRHSFFLSAQKAEEVFSVKVQGKADIVISVVLHPKDINLYHCQTAMENGKRILRKGGILIVVSGCRDGIGPSSFFEVLSGCQTIGEVPGKVRGEYKLGYHKAVKYADILKIGEIWAVTGLPESQVKHVFMRPFASVQHAVDEAIRLKGSRTRIAIIMDGDKTVPQL